MSNKYYRDMFELVDDIFSNTLNDAMSVFGNVQRQQPARHNKMISSSSFPPTNIFIDQKTKILTIQSALAGVKEEWIDLSFDGDNLRLTVKVPQTIEKDEKTEVCTPYYFQQGLKTFSELKTSWTVDPRYFNREKVQVKFDNGLLIIEIPPRDEVAPKKISVFGKLSETKKLEDSSVKNED